MQRSIAIVTSVVLLGLAAISHADESARAEASPSAPSDEDATLRELLDRIPQVDVEGRIRPEWRDERGDRLLISSARWRAKLPRECRTVGGYRAAQCGGARMVPDATGLAAQLADRLALHDRGVPTHLLHAAPLDEWIEAARGIDSEERLDFPVPVGYLGRRFGFTRTGRLADRRHNGVDIGAPAGSEIVAARGGLVAYSDTWLIGFGNAILIVHEDGTSAFYAHCSRNHVFAGQRVRRGQHIADVGETGFANAPHLHFEYRIRGWPRDPASRFIPREHPPTR